MSFKYITQKISDNHYVLPKMGNMKCDVHAFLNEKLFNYSEESCWTQAQNSACQEGVTNVYLMPDAHQGYGVPIGSVIVTEDTILQSSVGYDISCGIIFLKFPTLKSQDVASWDKRKKLVREIEKRATFGLGSERPKLLKSFRKSEVEDILRFGAKPLGISSDLCERQYLPISSIDLNKIEKAYNKAATQLGSIGSGNHYCEVQCDKDTGDVWVMIHCGSRGYGYQTANYFFHEAANLRGLPRNQRENSWLRIDEPLGKLYWNYMNSAANYAIANRHIISEAVNDAMKKIFKAEGELYYEISHNLVQEETLILPDGTTKKGFVHRKGATRAFSAGHPDLVGTKWESTGHPCLIPGSMFDGAAILFPDKDAYKTSFSVNHGSGRIMGRKEAKRKLKHKQDFIDDEMKNVKRKLGGAIIKGIVGNHKKTPLDECTHVYKKLDDVLDVLKNEGIATVKHRMYPIANLKGVD